MLMLQVHPDTTDGQRNNSDTTITEHTRGDLPPGPFVNGFTSKTNRTCGDHILSILDYHAANNERTKTPNR